jgi:hypothetical protein
MDASPPNLSEALSETINTFGMLFAIKFRGVYTGFMEFDRVVGLLIKIAKSLLTSTSLTPITS